MNRLNGVALAGLCFVLSGCATVINGTSQDFSINTDPGGARARVSTGTECTTPCEVSLKRRHDVRIDITKEGYEPAYVLVQSRTGGAIAGNVLLGGLVGGVVDAASGAADGEQATHTAALLFATDTSLRKYSPFRYVDTPLTVTVALACAMPSTSTAPGTVRVVYSLSEFTP